MFDSLTCSILLLGAVNYFPSKLSNLRTRETRLYKPAKWLQGTHFRRDHSYILLMTTRNRVETAIYGSVHDKSQWEQTRSYSHKAWMPRLGPSALSSLPFGTADISLKCDLPTEIVFSGFQQHAAVHLANLVQQAKRFTRQMFEIEMQENY